MVRTPFGIWPTVSPIQRLQLHAVKLNPLVTLALLALCMLTGCTSAEDEGPAATATAPPSVAPSGPVVDGEGVGTLRGVRFSARPIVHVRRCRDPECFPVTYVVYARLSRSVPRPSRGERYVAFDVKASVVEIDPLSRPPRMSRRRRCFYQAFFSDTPGVGAPIAVGAPIRFSFRVQDRRQRTIGEISATTRLRRARGFSSEAYLNEIGC